MTTIAYKDGVLAADTAICVGGTMMGSVIKVARRQDGDMAGAAGDAAYGRRFLEWFLAGEQGEPPEARETDHSCDRGIIFRASCSFVIFEAPGSFEASGPFFALGSGKSEAAGAMMAGADSRRAVEIACALDPHTGGEIVVLRHDGD